MNGSKYAKVFILDAPYHIDRSYDYYLPSELCGEVKPGSFVTVPFGGGNRRYTALVTALSDSCNIEQVKPVLAVTSDRYSLDEEMLGLCLFIMDYTLCTCGDAVRAMLPSSAFAKLSEYFICADTPPENHQMNEQETCVYNAIKLAGKASLGKIKGEFGERSTEILSSLCKKGFIVRDYELKESTNHKYTLFASLSVTEQEVEAAVTREPGSKYKIRSEKHAELLRALCAMGRTEVSALLEATGASRAQLNALVAKKMVEIDKTDFYRNPYADIAKRKPLPNILSEAQKAAFEKILALYRTREPKAALLFGVTGSGKTRVIKAMIDEVIKDGRSVIVLVPEISLTPQTVDLFCPFYGDRIAVLHSGLTAGERFDAWKKIRSGQVDLVIGTRSAVFAPLSNLGMIVIDEEQEHTYKSDMSPRYHARDIARYRCGRVGGLMLLASATPSIESYYKAQTGVYTLVELTERYGNATLPEVYISDIREQARAGSFSPIGSELEACLRTLKSKGEQAILFLNRRGYNNFISCKMCGEALLCSHCSVSLTYHRHREGAGYLMCHYCGGRREVPRICPSCKSEYLSYTGYGTQKVENELRTKFPDLTVMRMDADTTATKLAHYELLSKFRQGEADVLLGTQMVTKGHDFPKVTLVGVLFADASIYLDDYRAAERTFSLLTQVIGRAGRGDRPGLAIIQTMNPESEALKLACAQDYQSFYEKEIELRRALVFPPFCDIAQLTLTGDNEIELSNAATILATRFSQLAGTEYSDIPIIAYGPFEAAVYKVNEKYRMRMVVKCKNCKRMRLLFADLLREFGKNAARKVTLSVDFNPNSI